MFHAAPAGAGAIDQLVDPGERVLVDASHPFGFSYVLSGFDPLADRIEEFLLTITLNDDRGSERIRYEFDGLVFEQNNTGGTSKDYLFSSVTLAGLLGTLADGVLNVSLQATEGSYYFESSRLTGHFVSDSTPNPVPAPASLALVGLGLAALVVRRRQTGCADKARA